MASKDEYLDDLEEMERHYEALLRQRDQRIARLEGALRRVPNAAEYVLGTIGVGGAIDANRETNGFDVTIHRGRRSSSVRFLEQIRDAAREALDG